MSRVARQSSACLVLAAILLVSHSLFYASLMGFDAVDDAYISFRYAYNAARGHGLTFNIGERRVEGYTNFLWTVMLIPVFWLELPIHTTSLVLGALWALGSIVLLGQLGTVTESERWLGSIAALLLAADGSFALWAVGGLETPLFTFLVVSGGLAYLREMRSPGALPLSAAWFALAAMTRPEGLLVYGLTALHQATTRIIRERRIATRQDGLRLGLFALLWVPWYAFRWRYYGYPLPNTFYAKVTLGDTSAQLERGVAYVQTFLRVRLGYAPLAVALLPLLRRRWRMWSSYFWTIVLVYGIYIAYVGGDWSIGRFFVPLMPMYYALVVGGLILLWERIRSQAEEWRRRRGTEGIRSPPLRSIGLSIPSIAVAAIIGLAAAFFVQSSLNGEKALFLDPFDAGLAGRARSSMGKWLREHLPPDTYIAVDAAGQIPFYSDLRTLDLYGLNDLNIAHRQVEDMGTGTPGHEKMDMDYVIFVAQPDYIIIYGTAFDWLSAFSYERVDLPWTDDPEQKAFLGVYKRQ